MKKIVFADICMRDEKSFHKACYKGSGNAGSNYAEDVYYPINAILADKLKKDDDVKVVLIQTIDKEDEREQNCVKENTKKFITELNHINETINAKIEYKEVNADYNELKENHEKRIMTILEQMEEGAELYGDITFGPRTVPMEMLCAFAFAEKFYNVNVRKIVYGQVKWINNTPVEPQLFDITSLHYLNSLTYNMQPDSVDKAMESLKRFFSL